MRKIFAALAAITSVISLSACAPASSNPYNAMFDSIKPTCENYVTGEAADKIKVDGQFGLAPEVSFPTPLSSKVTETKVIVEGTGPKFTGDELVKVEYTGLNGGTGKVFQASKYDGTDAATQFLKAGQKPDFCHALAGAREGSRVAFIIPAEIAHGNQGVTDLGLGVDDSIVFVFDLVKVYLPYAVGPQQAPVAGMPAVVRAPNGVPGVTIPKTEAPSELNISTVLQGSGDAVKIGDTVTLHYSGFVWKTGMKFDSSWDNGEPAQWKLTSDGFIKGFVKALEGQKVGSQVLAVIPPDMGYGDQEQSSIPANSTLVFVIDILGTETN